MQPERNNPCERIKARKGSTKWSEAYDPREPIARNDPLQLSETSSTREAYHVTETNDKNESYIEREPNLKNDPHKLNDPNKLRVFHHLGELK